MKANDNQRGLYLGRNGRGIERCSRALPDGDPTGAG